MGKNATLRFSVAAGQVLLDRGICTQIWNLLIEWEKRQQGQNALAHNGHGSFRGLCGGKLTSFLPMGQAPAWIVRFLLASRN